MRHLVLGIARQGIVYRNGGIVNGWGCAVRSLSRAAAICLFFRKKNDAETMDFDTNKSPFGNLVPSSEWRRTAV